MMSSRVAGFFVALTLVGSSGCDARFVESGPTQVCTEVAAQCVLDKGPLGVCEQIPCKDRSGGPCFVCTSQH